jgi:hypothetical protein
MVSDLTHKELLIPSTKLKEVFVLGPEQEGKPVVMYVNNDLRLALDELEQPDEGEHRERGRVLVTRAKPE